MTWPSAEENTRLRARQLRRFHEKHISSKGPLKNADKITETDMDLATTLAPDFNLKFCDKDEEEYPKQWETNPRSLGFILSNFRVKAKEITAAINREIDAAITGDGDGTFIPPVFPAGYGDREQIRSLEVLAKRLHALFRKEKEKAKEYLASTEKAEAQLQRLLEGLEDEDDEEDGYSEDEDEDDDYDEEEENRKRKRRKIDGADKGVRETIHCSQPGTRTRK
ncbi:uncharacterized protein FTJAE_11501 [Fusarium tjaetaba]|uniref:Uncharacterized protein n=1 Tax=Fusarium tjaetaba TaxID=1567544 RepID=A0A8H5QQS7_9HYPO|nr:uncharacterized protein FTJAE_11501 [Fusarium tjaetaba]KAF5621160.1 hypothetical protein FTJAE_11501 [Fusarium tjaetaba]